MVNREVTRLENLFGRVMAQAGIILYLGGSMIHFLAQKVSSQQISEMLEIYPTMIKVVVDIRRAILTGGGEMHADCDLIIQSESVRRSVESVTRTLLEGPV